MPPRDGPLERARQRAREDRTRVGHEIRRARLAAGLTQRRLGAAVGISAPQVSRIERGTLPSATFDQVASLAAAAGLDIRVSAYPGPDPVRDAGSLGLIGRFRSRLAPGIGCRTEVPLPNAGDQRAWDMYLTELTDGPAGMPAEFETRIEDLQAQTRRLWLKARDAGEPDLILVIADTQRNRDAVRAAGASILDRFSITPRRALAALAEGRHPGGSALLFL